MAALAISFCANKVIRRAPAPAQMPGSDDAQWAAGFAATMLFAQALCGKAIGGKLAC